MLLTGKAKKDFQEWLQNRNCNLFDMIRHRNIDELVVSAYIIEWFDSVGVIIEIRHLEIPKTFYSFVHGIGIDFQEEHNDNRLETTKQAIIKANELYNQRHYNQD